MDAVLTFSWVGDVIFTGLLIVEGFLVFFVLGVCDDLVAASEDCLGFSCLGLLPVAFSAPSGILFLLVFLGGFLPVGSSSNMLMSLATPVSGLCLFSWILFFFIFFRDDFCWP